MGPVRLPKPERIEEAADVVGGTGIHVRRVANEVGTGTGTGAFEGTFSIANNGTVTFTSAVPEPSSVAVLFAGTTVLGCLRRRKSNP